MWAVIGGSGFDDFEGFEKGELLPRETPFGQASSGFRRVQVGGVECLYVPRHGENHELLPSEVNSCANFYAIKKHGATRCLALSAVGSLQEEIGPGDAVVPSQFINRTLGLRRSTFAGDGVVGHVALDKPVWPQAVEWLRAHAQNLAENVHFDKTYVCVEGPAFSTQAESFMHRTFKWDIIGMTAFPEYALAREAGICFVPLCFACDYDCWDDQVEHVTVQQIVETFARNKKIALDTMTAMLQADIEEEPRIREGHLGSCLLTNTDHIPGNKRQLLEVLAR